MYDKKIIFMGTPEFAVPCLQALIDHNFHISGVFTQTDKPKGRRYKMTPPPVKVLSSYYGIPVYQPERLDENTVGMIKEQKPDIIIVVAYGKILPVSLLSIPRYGCVNIHASLLPRYRGAAPIQWSVINGEEVTGVTSMYMDKGLDTGDIILKSETAIAPEETAGQLYDRLSQMGAQLLIRTLEVIFEGRAPKEKQNDEQSTYAPMLNKNTARIDWAKTNMEIYNLVRGTTPWPTAWTTLHGEIIKIHAVKMIEREFDTFPGAILKTNREDGIVVACRKGGIGILTLQIPGKQRMSTQDYLRGNKIVPNDSFL